MYVIETRYGTASYYGKRKPRLLSTRTVKRGQNWYMIMRFDDGSRARINLDEPGLIVDTVEV